MSETSSPASSRLNSPSKRINISSSMLRHDLTAPFHTLPSNLTLWRDYTDGVSFVVIVVTEFLYENLVEYGLENSPRFYLWNDFVVSMFPDLKNHFELYIQQYLAPRVYDNVRLVVNPTLDQFFKTVEKYRNTPKNSRVFFFYSGHGAKERVTDSKLPLVNESADIGEVLSTIDYPSCFIMDSDHSGSLYNAFSSAPGDRYAFFSCGEDELIARELGLPADFFTSTLLTPGLVSLLWSSRQFTLFKGNTMGKLNLKEIASRAPSLRSATKPIERVLKCLVRAMICSSCAPVDQYNAMFRDRQVSRLYTSFCLYKKINLERDQHPLCFPPLPNIDRHTLWGFYDLYVDRVLNILGEGHTGIHLNARISNDVTQFLNDIVTSIESYLDSDDHGEEPVEASLFGMALKVEGLQARGLKALARLLDCGDTFIRNILGYGIFKTLCKLCSTLKHHNEIPLLYSMAKILSFVCGPNENMSVFVTSPLAAINTLKNVDLTINYLPAVLVLIIISTWIFVCDKPEIQISEAKYLINLLKIDNDLIRFWVLIFLSLFASKSSDHYKIPLFQILNKINNLVNPEVKAAYLNAVSVLIGYEEEVTKPCLNFILSVLKFDRDPSHLVRMQLILLMFKIIDSKFRESVTSSEEFNETLQTLIDDPHPAISDAALEAQNRMKSAISTKPPPPNSLFTGSFAVFQKTTFSELFECCLPPFQKPLENFELVENVKYSIQAKGFKFTEIGHMANEAKVVSNLAFVGLDCVAFGDDQCNLIIHKHTDPEASVKWNSKSFLSKTAGSVPIVKILPIDDDSILLGTGRGDIAVLRNLSSRQSVLADCFRVPSTIRRVKGMEYSEITDTILIPGEAGFLSSFSLNTCVRLPDMELGNSEIRVVRSYPSMGSVIGVADDSLKLWDIRDLSKPAIITAVATMPIDFKPVPYGTHALFVAQKNGISTTFDVRNPDTPFCQFKAEGTHTVDVSGYAPLGLVAGDSLAVVDIYNGITGSVLDAIYLRRGMPKGVNSAVFHRSKPTMSFVVNNTNLHIVSIGKV